MRILFWVALLFIPEGLVYSQVSFKSKDTLVFRSVISNAQKINLADSSLNAIEIEVGKYFLGTPYVGGILDRPEEEILVVDLAEFDCVTFLENVMALSKVIKKKKNGFSSFCDELKNIRYRDGVMNGYPSRLHYFYDWIGNNEKKKTLRNITMEMGGVPFEKEINLMTKNRVKYPHLKNDSVFMVIKKVENELTSIKKIYIPKIEISNLEDKIHNGDLIALVSTIEGIEIAHVGMAIYVNNRLHFMHASSLHKKVEISDEPLFEMIKGKSIYSGIVVSRLSVD